MGQYSELIGSFIRTGNYPLEANYIFPTEAALKEFYNQPINKTTLHKGLLKIVANDSEQSLYWVIEKDSELQFEKLIESVDIINLTSQLEELKTRLEEHEEDYENLVSSVEDLQIAIDDLAEVVNEDINTLKVLIGITDDQDITEYLNGLPYDSLTSAYNALQEVKNFLKGYEEGDTLQLVLTNLVNNILGDPLPSEKFRTLRGIEDFSIELRTWIVNAIHNIQTELDQTQIGVGLSGDGAYNADKETYLLKNATSVMNALKILDAALQQLLTHPENLLSKDTSNNIIVKDNGLFFSISTDYENGILTVNVNGEPKYTHDLGLSAIVEESYYDSTTENIVIIFKLHSGEVQRVEIPADKLITEWDVEETATVSLNRERVIDGADILTANVKISKDSGNKLEVKEDGLFSTGGGNAVDVFPDLNLDGLIKAEDKGSYLHYNIQYNNLNFYFREHIEELQKAIDSGNLMYLKDSQGGRYYILGHSFEKQTVEDFVPELDDKDEPILGEDGQPIGTYIPREILQPFLTFSYGRVEDTPNIDNFIVNTQTCRPNGIKIQTQPLIIAQCSFNLPWFWMDSDGNEVKASFKLNQLSSELKAFYGNWNNILQEGIPVTVYDPTRYLNYPCTYTPGEYTDDEGVIHGYILTVTIPEGSGKIAGKYSFSVMGDTMTFIDMAPLNQVITISGPDNYPIYFDFSSLQSYAAMDVMLNQDFSISGNMEKLRIGELLSKYTMQIKYSIYNEPASPRYAKCTQVALEAEELRIRFEVAFEYVYNSSGQRTIIVDATIPITKDPISTLTITAVTDTYTGQNPHSTLITNDSRFYQGSIHGIWNEIGSSLTPFSIYESGYCISQIPWFTCINSMQIPVLNVSPAFDDEGNLNPEYVFRYYTAMGLYEGRMSTTPEYNTSQGDVYYIEVTPISTANVRILSQDEYDVIDPKDDNTLYVIP